MDKKSKLLFISNGIPSFTKIDIDILKSEFEVVLFSKLWTNNFSVVINHILLIIKLFTLRNKVSKIVISFASHWSYFPSIIGRLFNIPVAIILHGTDCASILSLNYGDLRKPILKRIIKSSIKNAMLGDVNVAEPGALIGFAGPRVIKETIGKDLPEGFQTSEFLLEKGFLDFIIDRRELKSKLSQIIKLFKN